MKTLKAFVVASLVAFTLVVPMSAQQNQITVADDSSSGTYKKMLGEVIGVCSTESFSIAEAQGVSGGAVGNLQALVDNKAQAAFMHSDVYQYNAQSDPTYNRFQTLVALYPEPIHVLALKQSKSTRTVSSTTFGITTGSQQVPVNFNSLSDIDGFKVGAAGGGWVTVRVLKGADAKFTPVEYPGGADVIKALDNGEIAAAIFVGAAPLPNLEKLDRSKYKILPIGEAIANRLANAYRTATVNYPGMTSGPVKTLAPLATLMTRKYSTPEKIAAQRHLRECIYKNLPALQDNASPNWQSVDVNDHGIATMPWLDLSATATASAVKK